MESKLENLESIIGYKFQNQKTLLGALCSSQTAAMSCGVGSYDTAESNSRLAMLGDRVLGLLLAGSQYQARATKGEMQDKLSKVASNRNMKDVGDSKGIGGYIVRNPGAIGEVQQKTMADTVEAIIGAAYLDGGLEAAKVVVHALGLE